MENSFTERFYALYIAFTNSWVPVAGVIFIVFVSATLLIDDFSIQADDLVSIGNAGRFDKDPNPLLAIQRLSISSQQHVPGYFIILSIWGNVIGWSPMILRILTVYFGILSLAMMYRFSRDNLSKEASLYVTIMLASLTFNNIWYLIIRMYTLFIFAELLLLWLYFRILARHNTTFSDYVFLTLASLLFINTHIFSLAIFFGLGMYHLVFVSKTRKWYYISGSVIVAALIVSPWVLVLIEGAKIAVNRVAETSSAISLTELITIILHLGVNGSVIFIGLVFLSARHLISRDRLTMALWTIMISTIAFYAVVNELTSIISSHRAHYLLLVFPLIILLIVKSLTGLQKWKIVIPIIVVFWVASGLLFHRRIGYNQYVLNFNSLPIHLIERQLRNDLNDNDLMIGWANGLNFDFVTSYGKIIDFYFEDHSIRVDFQHIEILRYMEDEDILTDLATSTDNAERIWLVYETDNHLQFTPLYHQALSADFERCHVDKSILNVVIELHQRETCD
jgi:hypothetical protein